MRIFFPNLIKTTQPFHLTRESIKQLLTLLISLLTTQFLLMQKLPKANSRSTKAAESLLINRGTG
jgi:hypothetical protein